MISQIFRRLLVSVLTIIGVHFWGFSYAYQKLNTLNARSEILIVYRDHLRELFAGTLLSGALLEKLQTAMIASFGLLFLAFILSTVLGLYLGLRSASHNPPKVKAWLNATATIGLSMPSFYLGSVFIIGIFYYLIWQGPGSSTPLPLQGYGWDTHLILPLLALLTRPTVQVAQITSEMLSSEFGKQYVVAARSKGYSWGMIRRHAAMRNVIGPILTTLVSSIRTLIGELIVVEWLFLWPGLGRLLLLLLIPGRSFSENLLYDPTLTSITLAIIALLFLSLEICKTFIVHFFDPRLNFGQHK